MDLVFNDDAAVTTNSEQSLHVLLIKFSDACDDFEIALSHKKTELF